MQNSRMQCQVLNFHKSTRQEQRQRIQLQNEHLSLTHAHRQMIQQCMQTNQANNTLTQQLRLLQLRIDTFNHTNANLQQTIQQQQDIIQQLNAQIALVESTNNTNETHENELQNESVNILVNETNDSVVSDDILSIQEQLNVDTSDRSEQNNDLKIFCHFLVLYWRTNLMCLK